MCAALSAWTSKTSSASWTPNCGSRFGRYLSSACSAASDALRLQEWYAIFACPSSSSYNRTVKKGNRLDQQRKLRALLRSIRVDAGLTQSELASRLDRDQTFVSKYESGERRLDVLELREVCQAIGTDFVTVVRKLDKELKRD